MQAQGLQNAGNIQHTIGYYHYTAASFTADAVGDTRWSNQSGVTINEICTVLNATKGAGTWIATSIHKKTFTLTDASANNLFEIALSDTGLTSVGLIIDFSIMCADAGDIQRYTGSVLLSAVSDGGVITSSIVEAYATAALPGATTLTTAWSIVDGANKITVALTPTSSLTPTSMTVMFGICNYSTQAITLL